jgi:arginine decarboxylase
MSNSAIQDARNIYNIAHWSEGYFDISEQGNLLAFPDGKRDKPGIDLPSLVKTITDAGLTLPVLVRFTDILKHRVDGMRAAFAKAMQDEQYTGSYIGAYPIKANQQRHLVEELLRHGGQDIGLEAGSKPELIAVLGLSVNPRSMIICNGYKDREFIRLALIGQQLGHRVFIIIEKLTEVDLVLEEAAKLNVTPRLGVRVRLASIGKGKWQNTGGEKSKFGLSSTQVLQMIDRLRAANKLSILQLVHFHLGSQLANIRDIQKGLQEAGCFYAELCKMGAPLACIDVGGGLGVDYEGTRSRSFCSTNYTVQEYANNIVHTIKEICEKSQLKHPQIITESGRGLTAHHAMLILNAIDVEQVSVNTLTEPANNPQTTAIADLWYAYQNLSERSLLEVYHDACYSIAEVQALFTHGTVSLVERAQAEQIYLAICLKVRDLLQPKYRAHREILDELNEKLADKIFVNFSLFQSLPDVWAIDQIFPIVPLSGLDKPIERRAVLQDLTCDSDGRIDNYIEGQSVQTSLPLPEYELNKSYFLGIFLIGAYQEILGDMHNLFGDTDSVHVELTQDGGYRLIQPEHGDTVADVLRYVHFEPEELLVSYRTQLERLPLSEAQKKEYFTELENGLHGYTYLED